MTGREIIMFILENHLEDTVIFDRSKFRGLLTVEEVAVMLNYGAPTVKALYEMKKIPGFEVNGTIYIYDSKELKGYIGKSFKTGDQKC